MPAKPLTKTQSAEASSLKSLFKEWQKKQRESGLEWSQDDVAEKLSFGQSAMSQYLNGKIPLNPDAAGQFAALMGLPIETFSPTIARAIADLSKTVGSANADQMTEAAAPPAQLVPAAPGARYLVLRLGELLKPLDGTDRSAASAILSGLAMNPDTADEMAAKMVRLLGELPLETRPTDKVEGAT